MTRCDIRSGGSRILGRNPVLDGYSLQGRSQQLANQGDVVIEVIRHVELRACSIRIQHADLYHGFLHPVTENTVGMRGSTATSLRSEKADRSSEGACIPVTTVNVHI